MTKTKVPPTRVDDLRRIVNRVSKVSVDELRDILTSYEEARDAVQEMLDALDEVNFEALDTVLSGLDPLLTLGLYDMEALVNAQGALEELQGLFPQRDSKEWEAFVENYEAAEQAIEAYENVKDEDRYEGKTDDVNAAYEELRASFELLADAYSALEEA